MNATLSKAFIFATGAAVGSAVMYKLLKTKYEKLANDEIDSIREYYEGLLANAQDAIDDYSTELEAVERMDRVSKADPEVKELVDTLNELGYSENKEVPRVRPPYVISPDEFGEGDYPTDTLYYYSDGVVADCQDNIVEDVDGVIGVDSLNHFGEYEDDSVFVRNDREGVDYEILLDPRNYSDVINSSLHPAEAE